MKKYAIITMVSLILSSLVFYSCNDAVTPTANNVDNSQIIEKKNPGKITVTVFASGLNAPRGLKFGPDGYLYVAEAGLGGDISTDGLCDQVIPPVGPYLGGNNARILKINSSGSIFTVVNNLPSSQNSLGDRLGVADIEFMENSLYALLAGGGCSHGHADYPASIIKINNDGSWSVVADLSQWQQNHPVAQPEADDFEPDGSWYSLIKAKENLYAIEPNHGEMVKLSHKGKLSRVIDFSASYGHIVPTAVAYNGNFFVGNLNTFPTVAGSSNIYKVTPGGQSSIWAKGFSTVLGVAFDKQKKLYVLETSSVDGFPTPYTGRVVKVNHNGNKEVVVDSLFFPTGMTFGPDGALYISNKGFGPPIPGFGEILKVNFKENHDSDNDDD
jgi:sugar lactone lactonase YvrE